MLNKKGDSVEMLVTLVIMVLLLSGMYIIVRINIDTLKAEAIQLDVARYNPTHGGWEWNIK